MPGSNVPAQATTVSATEFRQHVHRILNELASQGVVVTKRRKPIANVIPVRGSLADRFADVDDDVAVHPDDDLLTTGAWFSDEWGDLQDG